MQLVKHNSIERFSNRVDNYIKYRPHYPKEIIPFLEKNAGLNSRAVIADIGSGTGISTEPFLKHGNKVYAVEPNESMREAAEGLLNSYKNFISVNGTAERTTLQDNSINLIAAGQAFHWFNVPKAKTEFRRILKNNGRVVLIWNKKVKTGSDFMADYNELLNSLSTDYKKIKHENTDDKVFSKFFLDGKYGVETFFNLQVFDLEGLKGRYLSSSYAPLEGKEANSALKKLETIFNKHSLNGEIEFLYKTNLYYGKIK